MVDVFLELGIWNWVLLGFILLLLEIIFSGLFFIWFGIAALLVPMLAFILNFWIDFDKSWPLQLISFLIFSTLLIVIAYSFILKKQPNSQPLLNNPIDQLIGQTTYLTEAINNQTGSVHLNGTIWMVTGPELPKGAKIRVLGYHNGMLTVRAED